MSLCEDPRITYLRALGYNVIRHPREGLEPLQLIGSSRGDTQVLGDIDGLVTSTGTERPAVVRELAATRFNGRMTAKLRPGRFCLLAWPAPGSRPARRSRPVEPRTNQFQCGRFSVRDGAIWLPRLAACARATSPAHHGREPWDGACARTLGTHELSLGARLPGPDLGGVGAARRRRAPR